MLTCFSLLGNLINAELPHYTNLHLSKYQYESQHTPFSHALTQNGFRERDSATFAGKSGFRLVLEITKKVNKLQHSFTFFCLSLGNKRSKGFLLEHGVLAFTPPSLGSALWLTAPLCAAACSGHSSEIAAFLPVPTPTHCLSSPLSPREDLPPLKRSTLEGESKVSALQPHHPGVSSRLTTTAAPLHLPGSRLSSCPRKELD